MNIVAIIVIALIVIYILFGIIVKKKLVFNKFIVVILIACVGYLVIQTTVTNKTSEQIPISQAYQDKTPDISKAPYVIATSSRIYYVSNYKDNGKTITIGDYYSYDKKWMYKKDLIIDRKIYGQVQIYRR